MLCRGGGTCEAHPNPQCARLSLRLPSQAACCLCLCTLLAVQVAQLHRQAYKASFKQGKPIRNVCCAARRRCLSNVNLDSDLLAAEVKPYRVLAQLCQQAVGASLCQCHAGSLTSKFCHAMDLRTVAVLLLTASSVPGWAACPSKGAQVDLGYTQVCTSCLLSGVQVT